MDVLKRPGREAANALEELWRDSERRHAERIRQRNRWEWIRHFDRMARNHAAISEMYAGRAEELINERKETA